MTSVTIPNSVINIEWSPFSDCINLKYNEYDNALYLGNEDNPYLVLVQAKSKDINSCIIHSNTKIISDGAFGETQLSHIVIPKNVENVGYWAFSGCPNLPTIYCEAESQPSGWDDFWNHGPWLSFHEVVWGYKGEQ